MRHQFPELRRQVEREMGLKFKKKVLLKYKETGYPQAQLFHGHPDRIRITRRMAREDKELSKDMIRHELREVLLSQHLPNLPGSQRHFIACQYETLGGEVRGLRYYRRV